MRRDLARRGRNVETEWKRLSRVDTGRLRSSITSRVTTDSEGAVAIIGTNVEYAPFVSARDRPTTTRPAFLRGEEVALRALEAAKR